MSDNKETTQATATIPLTRGKVALVSPRDYKHLSQFRWRARFDQRTWYAVRNIYINGKRTVKSMHTDILGQRAGFIPDHINGDGLDNRRSNLRFCTIRQNVAHRTTLNKNNTSGYIGVSVTNGRYVARIKVNRKEIYLGTFQEVGLAVEAYRAASVKYNGKFASKLDRASKGDV